MWEKQEPRASWHSYRLIAALSPIPRCVVNILFLPTQKSVTIIAESWERNIESTAMKVNRETANYMIFQRTITQPLHMVVKMAARRIVIYLRWEEACQGDDVSAWDNLPYRFQWRYVKEQDYRERYYAFQVLLVSRPSVYFSKITSHIVNKWKVLCDYNFERIRIRMLYSIRLHRRSWSADGYNVPRHNLQSSWIT